MKTVQSQFQLEYSKNLSLETNALNTNFEMNRLTVIKIQQINVILLVNNNKFQVVAEYNNEVCKQLKGLITIKDKTISEMKLSLEKLGEIDKKYFEEKAALCNELTSASHMIKQLQNELATSNSKCLELNSNNASFQQNAEIKVFNYFTKFAEYHGRTKTKIFSSLGST